MAMDFGFAGRLSRGPYAAFTLLLSAAVVWQARIQGSPGVQSLDTPWTVLGRALDELVKLGLGRAGFMDLAVSVGLIMIFGWIFSVLTARRLRDLGQSPWWAPVVLVSGFSLPIMVVLSVVGSVRPRADNRLRSGSPDLASAE